MHLIYVSLPRPALRLALHPVHDTLTQEALDELVRDFANPDTGDRFLPFARHMDWYEGHSWAAGITPFAAGRNQVRIRAQGHQ